MGAEQGAGAQRAAKLANVRFGPYGQPGAYADRTVADVRGELGKLWSVPADATAYKGKEKLEDNYVIKPGDQIEFHRKMGEKG